LPFKRQRILASEHFVVGLRPPQLEYLRSVRVSILILNSALVPATPAAIAQPVEHWRPRRETVVRLGLEAERRRHLIGFNSTVVHRGAFQGLNRRAAFARLSIFAVCA
jgi:hypothetical protein